MRPSASLEEAFCYFKKAICFAKEVFQISKAAFWACIADVYMKKCCELQASFKKKHAYLYSTNIYGLENL